jgi:hypothetical protein
LETQLLACGQIIHDNFTEEDGPTMGDDRDDASDKSTSDVKNCQDTEAVEDELMRELTDRCGSMTLDDDGQVRFFGSQSNFHLLHGLSNPTRDQTPASVSNLDTPPGKRLDHTIDVPLELQEHLLGLYFRWLNPWVYVIEKDIFMRDFRRGNESSYCTPLVLLSIFSVASRFSDRIVVRTNPHNPATAGFAFAEQAKILLHRECETTTITAVQSAVLLSIWCMAENKEPAGW